jgi:cytochrome c-type biogenesis protein CcmH/NrfF
MNPSRVLLVSVFITAAILVIVGVVTTTLLVNDKASETQIRNWTSSILCMGCDCRQFLLT